MTMQLLLGTSADLALPVDKNSKADAIWRNFCTPTMRTDMNNRRTAEQ